MVHTSPGPFSSPSPNHDHLNPQIDSNNNVLFPLLNGISLSSTNVLIGKKKEKMTDRHPNPNPNPNLNHDHLNPQQD
jgi:hypothetical protein